MQVFFLVHKTMTNIIYKREKKLQYGLFESVSGEANPETFAPSLPSKKTA